MKEEVEEDCEMEVLLERWKGGRVTEVVNVRVRLGGGGAGGLWNGGDSGKVESWRGVCCGWVEG